jgi:PKD repeat protein
MKRNYSYLLIIQLLALLEIFTNGVKGATIYSTTSGGNRNTDGTWEGLQIPQTADDVIIRSGATVNTILGAWNSCNNLTVQPNGTLIYNSSGTITLTINGSLTNGGKIKNGTGNLILAVYGNITYTGSEWSNNKVSLAGSAAQQIIFSDGSIFSGSNFTVDGTVRTIQANSSLSFSNTAVDFNLSTLALMSNCKLAVSGQLLADIQLSGPDNELEMTSGAYLNNSTLYNTTLKGVIASGTGTNHFSGTVTVSAGAYLENYGTSHTLYVDGSIINNGTIVNGSNNLTLYITGDIINNGTWENYETNLSGGSDQHITCGSGSFFSGSYFNNLNCQSKTIFVSSDIEFRGINVNFAYGSPGTVRGNVILPDGKWLKASGGGVSHSLSRLNLGHAGTEAKLWLETGQYLTSFSDSSSMLTLLGSVQIGSSEIYFNNEVRVMDTLINYGSSHTVYVNGNLTNLGYILNNASSLDIQVTGNITHHGISWSNNKVVLAGTAPQSIACSPFSQFTGAYFECNSAHEVDILTNVEFQGTRVNLMNSMLMMTNGTTLAINGANAKIYNSSVNGDFTLFSAPDAYISSMTFGGSVTLQGTTQVFNNAIYFNGAAENQGIFQNQNLSAHTVYFKSHFTNNGTVQNGAGMGNLMMELKGNIINNGTWNNYSCALNGTSDQHVRLVNNQPINCPVTLSTPPGGNYYQWYKDGQIIPGATSANLYLPSISASHYGLYYCTSTLGESRHFTIQEYMIADFSADPANGCNPQQTGFTDNSISTYDIQDWHWEFGDGGTSAEQNPSHMYQDTGAWSVSLTVSDGYLSRKITKTNYIAISLSPVPDFSSNTVCHGTPTIFTDLTTNMLYARENEIRYANSVIGYSSQYSTTNWAAAQALGAPDVWPDHLDDVHAWASLTANNQREYLELGFPNARQVNKVIIYETLYPGSIDTVYVKNPSTLQWVMVWSGTAAPQPLAARAFEVSFPLTSFNVDQVRIAINSPAVPYWNEIDAVALINPLPETISDQTTYLWNVGENDVTLTAKGDVSYTYQTSGDHNVSLTVTNNGICADSISKTVHVYPQSSGGIVTGGKTIHWGQSTETLALSGQTGDILKWQKRLDGGSWTDIINTDASWSEFPTAMGAWDYRAQIQNGTCQAVFSSPATVLVIKPLAVTWNGSVNDNWHHPSNWTPAYIPEHDIDVSIPAVDPGPFPIITGSEECNNLAIHPAGSLTIASGAILVVEGDCTLEEN